MLRAVGKDGEVALLQIGDDLAALLVIDNRVDVDDLRRDADFLEVLRLGGGSMSLRKRLLLCSPGLAVSPGRLFFFSLEVGGWRLDCDHPGLILAPSSNNESAIAKNG